MPNKARIIQLFPNFIQVKAFSPIVILTKTTNMKISVITTPTPTFLFNLLKYRYFRQFILLFSMCGLVHGQTTIGAWNFNAGVSTPSSGIGSSTIYGSLNPGFPNASPGKCWELTSFANQSSSNGTKGVGFNVSTVGYTNIKVNFDQRASGYASRWTQLDYSIDGTNWILGYWNNNGALIPKDTWFAFSVDFTNVSGVANNPNFKVRLVSIFSPQAFDESTLTSPFLANSAYMMTNSGALYSPASSTSSTTYSGSGSWRFDNVSIKGFSIPVINAQVLTSAMNAEYGTNSNALPVTISATNLLASISATPEFGFEHSTNASTGFSSSPLTGLINGSVIYVRTVANKSVGAFNSTSCIVLQSNWAVTKNVTTKSSGNQISQKALQITADDVYKEMGLALVSGTGNTAFSATGLISGESISSISVSYGLAGASSGVGSIVGTYANQVTPSLPVGTTFTSSNYLVSFVNGTIYVTGFTPGNLIVNRIGDGASVLGSITYPLNLQEFLPTGVEVQTMNQQFTSANLLTETGELNTSIGHLNSLDALVGVPGYNSVSGVSNVAVSQPKAINILGLGAAVNGRVVFPANGNSPCFTDGYLTSLLPMNTTTFFAAGTGINGSGGIWYYNGTNFLQLNGDFNEIRTIESYNGNLYFSTDVSPSGIYQLGSGLPITSGQVATLIIATASPRGFSISPDGNTAFVADDSPLNGNNGGGIQKWTQQNGTWTKAYTHAYRASGLTVDFSDSLARIYATTFLNSPGSDNNKILKIIDTDENSIALELSLAGTNYLYKGLDFAPALPPAALQIVQVEHPTCIESTGKIHFTGLPAGQWRITGNPSGSKTGTGATAVVENLSPGQSYTFKVTSYTGRNSVWTTSEAINVQPEIPTIPTGSAIQKRCHGSTLSELNLNQSNVLWYESVNSTSALNATASLVHNTHYYASQLNINGCESNGRCDVVAKLVNNGEWKGENEGSWKHSTNWCGGVPAVGASVMIPESTTIYLDTVADLNELTIQNSGILHISNSKNLTLNGDLTLNGELTLHDKATLVQYENSGWLGNGSIHVKQAISGTGANTPNGRYWYVGSPMSNSVSQDFKAETSALLKYFNEPTGSWVEINNSTTPIEVGKGYFVQTGVMDTLAFSGGHLNNGNYTFPCTRTGSTNSFRGYNLIANPYASYLDFNAATKTNILPTIWYRTSDLSQSMVYDTYNSELLIGTSLSGNEVTQFVPPMQSFWVKIPSGFTTGSIGFSNSMRSHHATGFVGLKSSAQNFPVYVRFNLEDGMKKDQMIVLMDQQMSASVDGFDSEKMLITGSPQVFTTVGSTKLVINSLPYSKSKVSVPITLNLPVSKSYLFQTEEIHIADGLVLLEDKQEQIFQDLSINPCYGFYSNSGVISDRFVLHMNLPNGVQSTSSMFSTLLTNSSPDTDLFEIFESSDQEIQINFSDTLKGACSLRIFDASGRLIRSMNLTDMETTIPLTQGSGIYFVQLEMNQQIFRKKIVITQK